MRLTEYDVDCPWITLAPGGAALKLKAGTIVRGVVVLALLPFTVTLKGPVTAPAGITKARLVAVALETGAEIVPTPCLASVT